MSGAGSIATLALGFVLGLRHATEADHLVAVSTLVTERRSLAAGAFVGLLWGLGHTTALLVAGVLVLVAGLAIPQSVSAWLELAVAAMIVLLGARLLWPWRATAVAPSAAQPGRQREVPALHGSEVAAGGAGEVANASVNQAAARRAAIGWRPAAVGVMHGLAGSAAMTVLIQAQFAGASPLLGIAYLLIFGAGSVAGMLAMGLAIGLPFALGATALVSMIATLQRVAGGGSVLFGLWYGWQAL